MIIFEYFLIPLIPLIFAENSADTRRTYLSNTFEIMCFELADKIGGDQREILKMQKNRPKEFLLAHLKFLLFDA